MSDENDQDLSDLFASGAPLPRKAPEAEDAQFVNRVSSRLQTRRRVMLAVRVALIIGVLVTIAPFLPSFIASLLKVFGLSIS